MPLNEEGICRELARVYAEIDWHTLDERQQRIVTNLERLGYLIVPNPLSGFVGRVSHG